jgi:hypothetical protein
MDPQSAMPRSAKDLVNGYPLSFSGLVPPELPLEQACARSTRVALAAPIIALFVRAVLLQLFIVTSRGIGGTRGSAPGAVRPHSSCAR